MANINFDVEEFPDIANKLVPVSHQHYVKKCWKYKSATMFGIPKEIVYELQLTPGDSVYFYDTPAGTFISFKHAPHEYVPKHKMIQRKINIAGEHNLLFIRIPPKYRRFPIHQVRLTQPQYHLKYEWRVQFITTGYV